MDYFPVALLALISARGVYLCTTDNIKNHDSFLGWLGLYMFNLILTALCLGDLTRRVVELAQKGMP